MDKIKTNTLKTVIDKAFKKNSDNCFDKIRIKQNFEIQSDKSIFKKYLNDNKIKNKEQFRTWLRDEHQIYIEINTDCTTEPKFSFQINVFKGNPRDLAEKEWGWYYHKHEPWYLYYSYEDALEDALVESINLLGRDLIFDD